MLSAKIIEWYQKNRRDLPWRETRDPYYIWLSEVILQQTRVVQGLPYYQRFITTFPTVSDLAHASDDEVLRLWQGLGYYSRARNLHKTARYITDKLEATFPDTYEGLLKLPGIGPYTAAAIASFAFDRKNAVIDGNVYRVLSRIYEIDIPINSSKGIKYFADLANELIPGSNPADFNQGLMELGATVCVPRNPDCPACPVFTECMARKNQSFHNFPAKKGKTKVRTRHFNYLILTDRDKTYLQKRGDDDIWRGLYEFLLIETEEEVKDPLSLSQWHSELEGGKMPQKLLHEKHLLSHQRIEAVFWQVEAANLPSKLQGKFYNQEEIEKLPKPRLVEKFLLNYSDKHVTLKN